jgi:hypothetical protein
MKNSVGPTQPVNEQQKLDGLLTKNDGLPAEIF